jgi:hypothetical protein
MTSRLVLLLAAAAGLPAADLPTRPEPLRFGVENVAFDQRVDLSHGQPTLTRSDQRVTLSAPLPLEGAALRLHDAELAVATSDCGERVGLLMRPNQREQTFTIGDATNRDRMVRIVLDVTPPAKPCVRLTAVSGSLTLTLGSGTPIGLGLAPTKGASGDAAGFGTVTVAEATAKAVTLRLPPSLAERLARVEARDQAGLELPSKLRPPARKDDITQLTIELETAHCARLTVAWWPEVREQRIAIAIAEIDIPGGLPGIGALAEAPGAAPPQLPKPASLKDALNRAVGTGDDVAVESLLAKGADPAVVDGDGRTALMRAACLGDEAAITALIAHHADPGLPGRDGWAPLHAAVAANQVAAAKALVAAGADPLARAKDGRSSLDLARDLGRWHLLRLLLGNPE